MASLAGLPNLTPPRVEAPKVHEADAHDAEIEESMSYDDDFERGGDAWDSSILDSRTKVGVDGSRLANGDKPGTQGSQSKANGK